jgi:hypothetical protein
MSKRKRSKLEPHNPRVHSDDPDDSAVLYDDGWAKNSKKPRGKQKRETHKRAYYDD